MLVGYLLSNMNSSFGKANIGDFTIRGGILAPLKAAEDVSIRLTRFFADIKNPKGLLFLAKENILISNRNKNRSI
jgi:hypothetical protein